MGEEEYMTFTMFPMFPVSGGKPSCFYKFGVLYQCAAEGSSLSLLIKSLGQSLVRIYFLREEREHTRQRRVREVPGRPGVCLLLRLLLYQVGLGVLFGKEKIARFILVLYQ